jgi:hypothetical protein
MSSHGYPMLKIPHHPRADSNGWVCEHVIVAEIIMGRPLNSDEVVHHIGGDRANNHVLDLVVLKNQAEHMRVHAAERKYDPAQLEMFYGIEIVFYASRNPMLAEIAMLDLIRFGICLSLWRN